LLCKQSLIFLFAIVCAFCQSEVLAAQTCDEKLHDLIVSNIPAEEGTFPYTERNNKALLTDLEKNKDGLYDIYVKAKRYGLTVIIDTKKNVIYYADAARDSSKYWKVSPGTVKDFASQCFKEVTPGNLDITELPISIYEGDPHGWPECIGHAHAMNHCGLQFHEYTKDQLNPNISKQVGSNLKYFLKLPPLGDLSVFLGETDTPEGDIYMLYVFKGDAMTTKEVIGKRDVGKGFLNFDINKDYSIHQIVQNQVRPETEDDSGLDFKELYKKLDANGKLLKCTKLNVSCK
jgi:hypothetical protein